MEEAKKMDRKHLNVVIQKIDEKLQQQNSYVVAIDGMCGSGKSTLASLLEEYYDCNVFHMDDYFLPIARKTKERLAEPGGNVDYERFREEIVDGVLQKETNWYRPYNCAIGGLEEAVFVEHKKLTIVEGSYSLHPTLFATYDLKIFLEVDREIQLNRILRRNGEEKLQRFIQEWIPMEQHYFDAEDIYKRCDIRLDTSAV